MRIITDGTGDKTHFTYAISHPSSGLQRGQSRPFRYAPSSVILGRYARPYGLPEGFLFPDFRLRSSESVQRTIQAVLGIHRDYGMFSTSEGRTASKNN